MLGGGGGCLWSSLDDFLYTQEHSWGCEARELLQPASFARAGSGGGRGMGLPPQLGLGRGGVVHPEVTKQAAGQHLHRFGRTQSDFLAK